MKRTKRYKMKPWFYHTTIVLAFIVGAFAGGLVNAHGARTVEEVKPLRTVFTAPKVIVEEEPIEEVEIVEPEEQIVKQAISVDFDILQPSGYTAEQLALAVSSNSHRAFLPYIDTFIEAEAKYGVNALYLLCKLGLESGWGRYTSGANNIGGWKNSDGTFMSFDSVDSCILHIAEKLSTSFRDDVGTRLEDVCNRYCTDEGYLNLLMQIMIERQNIIEGAI